MTPSDTCVEHDPHSADGVIRCANCGAIGRMCGTRAVRTVRVFIVYRCGHGVAERCGKPATQQTRERCERHDRWRCDLHPYQPRRSHRRLSAAVKLALAAAWWRDRESLFRPLEPVEAA